MLFMFIATGATAENASKAAEEQNEMFEKAVKIIKKYEGLHQSRSWPFIGYGHKVLPGEKYKRGTVLTEKQADALLRSDLKKLLKVFRQQGQHALLLATLAYNIGQGNVKKSQVYKKIIAGNTDIKSDYLSHSRYNGRKLRQLQRRRAEEFETLFNKTVALYEYPSKRRNLLTFNLSCCYHEII